MQRHETDSTKAAYCIKSPNRIFHGKGSAPSLFTADNTSFCWIHINWNSSLKGGFSVGKRTNLLYTHSYASHEGRKTNYVNIPFQ